VDDHGLGAGVLLLRAVEDLLKLEAGAGVGEGWDHVLEDCSLHLEFV
jgi:hypothetical protein